MKSLELKQCWSTIPPISLKRPITFHNRSLNIEKCHDNQGPGLGQMDYCGDVKHQKIKIRHELTSR